MNFEVQPACLFFYLRRPIVSVCLWSAEKKKHGGWLNAHSSFQTLTLRRQDLYFFKMTTRMMMMRRRMMMMMMMVIMAMTMMMMTRRCVMCFRSCVPDLLIRNPVWEALRSGALATRSWEESCSLRCLSAVRSLRPLSNPRRGFWS